MLRDGRPVSARGLLERPLMGFEPTGRVEMSERDGEEKEAAVDPGSRGLWGKILRRRRSRHAFAAMAKSQDATPARPSY